MLASVSAETVNIEKNKEKNKYKEKFRDTFNLRQDYELYLDSINWDNQTIILQLTKNNGSIIQSKTIKAGNNFTFYDYNVPNQKIVNATFRSLFIGRDLYAVRIIDLTQYNKNNGRIIYIEDNMFLYKRRWAI